MNVGVINAHSLYAGVVQRGSVALQSASQAAIRRLSIARRASKPAMIRVGINGFSRIGRVFTRLALDRADLEMVAVNDITDARTLAHLLAFDSTYGRLGQTVEHAPDALVVDGTPIAVLAERDPAAIDWAALGADVVVESTGKFRTRDGAGLHLKGEVAPGLLIDTGLLPVAPPALAVTDSGSGALMLVVGARGAGGFAAMVLGSVSRYTATISRYGVSLSTAIT
jgi:glyceraldehyde 3-phosphate dehydrogenase-like protein